MRERVTLYTDAGASARAPRNPQGPPLPGAQEGAWPRPRSRRRKWRPCTKADQGAAAAPQPVVGRAGGFARAATPRAAPRGPPAGTARGLAPPPPPPPPPRPRGAPCPTQRPRRHRLHPRSHRHPRPLPARRAAARPDAAGGWPRRPPGGPAGAVSRTRRAAGGRVRRGTRRPPPARSAAFRARDPKRPESRPGCAP